MMQTINKLYNLLPIFVKNLDLIHVLLYTVGPLIILILINTGLRNNKTIYTSQDISRKVLAFLIAIWLLITVYIDFLMLYHTVVSL